MSISLNTSPRTRLPSACPPSKLPKLSSGTEQCQPSITTQSTISTYSKPAVRTTLPKPSASETSNKASKTSTAAESPRTSCNHHPHYIAEHVGDPCTLGSLDHLLQCSHKILTPHAESCASNCQPCKSQFPNPKSIDRPFVCMACITQKMKAEHDEKLWSFLDDLEVVASATGKCDADAWIAGKAGTMDGVWRDCEVGEMVEEVGNGRWCYAVQIDEEYWEAYAAIVARVEGSTRVGTDLRSSVAVPIAGERAENVRKGSRIPKKPVARCTTLM